MNDTYQSIKKAGNKILFIHNSVPEYRIEFWKSLSSKLSLELLITNVGLDDKIYGLDKDTTELNIKYWNIDLLKTINKDISNYTTIILPPADTIKEYLIGLIFLFLCKLNNIKCVYWTEKWEADWNLQPIFKKSKNMIHRFMIGSLARFSDQCIASGSKSYQYLVMNRVKARKINIVYDSSTSNSTSNYIDFYEKYSLPQQAKVILYFGRIVKRKGLMQLIQAMEIIRDDNVWLIVSGEGDHESECKKYIKDNGIKNIVFTGKIQPVERKAYYERADVFVLPSYSYGGTIEAWGLTVNEALESGTPVVSTTAVGSAYDLLDGLNGVMISECNISELVDAIRNFIYHKDSNLVKIYCAECAKKYSVENMALGFYEVCLD